MTTNLLFMEMATMINWSMLPVLVVYLITFKLLFS